MTEGPQVTEDPAAQRAAEQARLRKERREAKIKAGGAARLNKITGLGGGIQRDPVPQPSSETSTPQRTSTTSTPTTKPTQASEQHGDPDEVDISQHYYEPSTTARLPPGATPPNDISEAQLRQLILGLDRQSSAGNATNTTPPQPGRNPLTNGPLPPVPGAEGMEDDPMMKMLSQLMSGGMPGGAGAGAGDNPFAGTPMEGLLGGLGGMNTNGNGTAGPSPMQQAQQVAADKSANLWRILHAIFALGLGLYVALSTTFSGTLTEREHSAIASRRGKTSESTEQDSVERARAYFFVVFASVEALLLTTRYFLDKGKGHGAAKGWMWTASGFLPGRARTYVQHALRYGQMLSTVRGDALVCVFVLGVCAWLRS
ncbi:uncharacterized protein F4812DRAFT_416017 [Daldinia caldariorum]|uniref:uncharacterized protein n=1 Tax=Daldinia caldariorum TaxID=326644 RepID=UPI002007AAA7|nr:uncharacterized protein F4812DRAFT_416017 [Daldinia caldariorum]KAI1471918.1 hypothetical protein F4812DRAFT_416017 [Daldinia caldariorum]